MYEHLTLVSLAESSRLHQENEKRELPPEFPEKKTLSILEIEKTNEFFSSWAIERVWKIFQKQNSSRKAG